ncbi:MAG: restriction endonuclease subunit R [Cyanobacteria bacterium P01_F01_bin.143]
MVQVISASELTLNEVETKFNLQPTEDEQFFPEWHTNLPEISNQEKKSLDQVKADFLYLNKYPLFEEAVKMVVLSPLLTAAGFYRMPFRIREEVPIQLALEEAEEIVRGRIDVLVIQEQFWVLVIESKQAGFSLKTGIAQALSYMVAAPNQNQSVLGMVTNGSHFIFLKLTLGETNQYALSDEFSLLKRGNDLYTVLSILKHIGKEIS